MLTTVEGIYDHGQVKLDEVPQGIERSRVYVTFVRDEASATKPGQMITLGMFQTDRPIDEDDFKQAEFHGDPDDGLDWS